MSKFDRRCALLCAPTQFNPTKSFNLSAIKAFLRLIIAITAVLVSHKNRIKITEKRRESCYKKYLTNMSIRYEELNKIMKCVMSCGVKVFRVVLGKFLDNKFFLQTLMVYLYKNYYFKSFI